MNLWCLLGRHDWKQTRERVWVNDTDFTGNFWGIKRCVNCNAERLSGMETRETGAAKKTKFHPAADQWAGVEEEERF